MNWRIKIRDEIRRKKINSRNEWSSFLFFFLNGTKVCLKLKWHRKAANAIRFAVCHQVSSYDGRRSRVERKNNPQSASGRYMDTDSRRSFNAILILLILNHDYCSIYTRLSNDTLFFFFHHRTNDQEKTNLSFRDLLANKRNFMVLK